MSPMNSFGVVYPTVSGTLIVVAPASIAIEYTFFQNKKCERAETHEIIHKKTHTQKMTMRILLGELMSYNVNKEANHRPVHDLTTACTSQNQLANLF